MIRPEELRIGNWVEDEVLGTCTVSRIMDDWVDVKVANVSLVGKITHKNYQIRYEDLTPIPLTEEWLRRFGIAKKEHLIFTSLYEIDLGRKRALFISDVNTPNQMICIKSLERDKNDIICIWNFDYDGKIPVHKFQNLYFALTGKELKTE